MPLTTPHPTLAAAQKVLEDARQPQPTAAAHVAPTAPAPAVVEASAPAPQPSPTPTPAVTAPPPTAEPPKPSEPEAPPKNWREELRRAQARAASADGVAKAAGNQLHDLVVENQRLAKELEEARRGSKSKKGDDLPILTGEDEDADDAPVTKADLKKLLEGQRAEQAQRRVRDFEDEVGEGKMEQAVLLHPQFQTWLDDDPVYAKAYRDACREQDSVTAKAIMGRFAKAHGIQADGTVKGASRPSVPVAPPAPSPDLPSAGSRGGDAPPPPPNAGERFTIAQYQEQMGRVKVLMEQRKPAEALKLQEQLNTALRQGRVSG